MEPLINGVRHSWSDIKINLLGRTVSGVDAIEYGDNQDKQNNYGAGAMPVSRGVGQYKATTKLTLKQFEIEAIQTAAVASGYKRIQEIPAFPIIVSYLNPSDKVVVHTINNVEFTDNKRAVKAGDMDIAIEFTMIISDIDWGL